MKTTQRMVLDEPKKHSVRYNAPGDLSPAQIGLTSIYVGKRMLPPTPPPEIWVTIDTEAPPLRSTAADPFVRAAENAVLDDLYKKEG